MLILISINTDVGFGPIDDFETELFFRFVLIFGVDFYFPAENRDKIIDFDWFWLAVRELFIKITILE